MNKRVADGIVQNEPLANKTWLGVGGSAEWYAEPDSVEDLQRVLKFAQDNNLRVTVLGKGSNILIRDGGLDGLVIRLGRALDTIKVEDNVLVCGGATPLMSIAKKAAENNISGFEFMCGIPGSLGGGFKTNAGAYGSDLGKITTEIVALDLQGNKHIVHPADEDVFEYRHTKLPTEWIFVEAKLVGKSEPTNTSILEKMNEYQAKRTASQPVGVRTAGSTFKNPPQESAWKLLDAAGFRGFTKGDAQFSEKHPNFLINLGAASAQDLENLIREAQQKVKQQTGINLECEIQIMGKDQA